MNELIQYRVLRRTLDELTIIRQRMRTLSCSENEILLLLGLENGYLALPRGVVV